MAGARIARLSSPRTPASRTKPRRLCLLRDDPKLNALHAELSRFVDGVIHQGSSEAVPPERGQHGQPLKIADVAVGMFKGNAAGRSLGGLHEVEPHPLGKGRADPLRSAVRWMSRAVLGCEAKALSDIGKRLPDKRSQEPCVGFCCIRYGVVHTSLMCISAGWVCASGLAPMNDTTVSAGLTMTCRRSEAGPDARRSAAPAAGAR